MNIGKYAIAATMAMNLGGCVADQARVEQALVDPIAADPSIAAEVFSGLVTNEQGTPLAGVSVVINGITRVTSATGMYFMSVASVDTGYNISLSKNGFAPASEFRASGSIDLQHALRSGHVATVNPATDSTVITPGGVTVALKANSLVTTSGAAPTGMVQVTVAAYDPLQMPGDFTAVNAAGAQVALESVGAVFVGASDSAGQTLELRSGMTSDAFIPVPAAVGTMPSCVSDRSCRIAMWKFDPNTGKWAEDPGTAPQFGPSGTRFTMVGGRTSHATQAIVVSKGLGMWNADIEKTAPACTIIELVNVPLECYGAKNRVQFNLKLPNSAGTLISRTDFITSDAPYIVLYNIRANVVQEVGMTFPSDAPSAICGRPTISSDPGPAAGFPVTVANGGVTRFAAGAPWGRTGYPVNSAGQLLTFADVARDTHPCKSHVWFQL